MSRLTIVALCMSLLFTAEFVSAQRVKQRGRSIVEFTSPDVKAVAAYEYSRRNHSGEWLLVELAVQARKRIAIERSQINLLTADERTIPLGMQQEFVTNPDEVASGDLFFKSAGGGWASGTYKLVLSHPDARAELPIELD